MSGERVWSRGPLVWRALCLPPGLKAQLPRESHSESPCPTWPGHILDL